MALPIELECTLSAYLSCLPGTRQIPGFILKKTVAADIWQPMTKYTATVQSIPMGQSPPTLVTLHQGTMHFSQKTYPKVDDSSYITHPAYHEEFYVIPESDMLIIARQILVFLDTLDQQGWNVDEMAEGVYQSLKEPPYSTGFIQQRIILYTEKHYIDHAYGERDYYGEFRESAGLFEEVTHHTLHQRRR